MVVFVCEWLERRKENVNNMTEFSFSNARNAPDKFKEGIKSKIDELLNSCKMDFLQSLLDSSSVPAITAFILGIFNGS